MGSHFRAAGRRTPRSSGYCGSSTARRATGPAEMEGRWGEGPVEDLWYHALKFLDKYRTDVGSYDISELYEFADKTGILERHRQMLSQPFQESQVDMKIMYYELIRMLIDYERTNHPETYDATKTVGKIEGYQELTNKLQRYLNQRFIEDINDLLKGQQGSTVNISQRFDQMEQNYSSLEATNITLQNSLTKLEQKFNSFVENHDSQQQNFTVLQSTNSSLVEKVRLLERNQEEARLELSTAVTQLQEELAAKEKLQSAFKEQQLVWAQEVAEQFSSASFTSSTLQSQLEEQEKGSDAYNKRIAALESDIADIEKLKLTEKLTELEKNEVDIQLKMQNLESADVFIQEAHRMLMEKTSNVELEQKQMDINFDQLRMSTEKKIQMNLQTTADNTKLCHSTADSVKSILIEQSSISAQINGLRTKHTESWTSVDSFLSQQAEMVTEMREMGQNFSKLGSRFDDVEPNVTKNSNNIKEIISKVTSQGNRMEEIESETYSGRERVNKINENVDTLNRSVATFESYHTETTQKIHDVQIQEQKIVEQNNTELQKVMKQVKEVEDQAVMRITELGKGANDIMVKLVQLEDGYMNQQQKVAMIEHLGDRVNQMDEQRQKSEAMARDEVDASMSRSKQQMEQLEKKIHETAVIQAEKIPLMESMKAKLTKIEEEQVNLDEQRREEIRVTVTANSAEIDKLKTYLEKSLGDIRQGSQQKGEVMQNALLSLEENMRRVEERFGSAELDMQNNAMAFQSTLETRLGDMKQSSKQQGEVTQNALLSLEQTLRSMGERFEATEDHLQSSALAYQTSLDETLRQLTELQQKQEKEVQSLSQSMRETKEKFAENEVKLSQATSSYHELLDVRLGQVAEDVSRLRGEGEAVKTKVEQHDEDLHAVAVKYQELIEESIRELKEETKMNTNTLVEIEPIAKGIEGRLELFGSQHADKFSQFRQVFSTENIQRFESLRSELKSSIEHINKEVQISTKLITDKSGNQSEAFDKFCDENRQILRDVQLDLDRRLDKQYQQWEDISNSRTNEIQSKINEISEQINMNITEIVKVNNDLTALGVLTNENFTNVQESMATLKTNEDTLQENMSKIMEQTNSLLYKNASQDAKLNMFESHTKDIERKLSSLEEADRFLQESYKQLTERTISLENGSKEMEERLVRAQNDQQEVIEVKIKPHLIKLEHQINAVQEENSNNSDMFENLTNKATDSMMSQINILKSENDVTIKSLQNGLEDGLNAVKNEIDIKIKEEENRNQKTISYLEADNKKNTQELFSVQQILKQNTDHNEKTDKGMEGLRDTIAKFEDVIDRK